MGWLVCGWFGSLEPDFFDIRFVWFGNEMKWPNLGLRWILTWLTSLCRKCHLQIACFIFHLFLRRLQSCKLKKKNGKNSLRCDSPDDFTSFFCYGHIRQSCIQCNCTTIHRYRLQHPATGWWPRQRRYRGAGIVPAPLSAAEEPQLLPGAVAWSGGASKGHPQDGPKMNW